MKIRFNRRKIETFCIFLSFVLVIILALFGIFAIADGLFSWDLLTEKTENIVVLIMSAIGIIIGATFLISLMVNLSLISINVERIADGYDNHKVKKI